MSIKTIVNLLYHAVVLSGLALGYSILGESILRMRSANIGRLEDTPKTIGVVAISIATQDFLVDQGIIPHSINY